MVEVYQVVGSDTEYIAADEELGITDFSEDAKYDERFESLLEGFEVEDLVPSGNELDSIEELTPPGNPEEYVIHVLERDGEELKWGKTFDQYLANALSKNPQE